PTKVAGASAVIAAGPGAPFGLRPLADAAGPPVPSENVVPNKKGGVDTITMDRGSFSSLSGDKLTITQGTKSRTDKTLPLTIPSGASVTRNGEAAKPSDLKSGDTVMVAQSPNGTDVAAHDAQHPDLLQLKLRVPQKGERPFPLPKPPATPE